MEDIEYLDEYKDLVMPGINKNVSRASAAATSAASALESGQRRRRLSSDSTNSSSIDADIFQKLFHGKFTDDELPSKNNSKGRGRRSPFSPSSSDESNDALEALFNRKTNLGTQAHKRRERYESLDSIDDLSQALMRPTHRSSATKPKKEFPQKTSSSSTSNSNRGNVSAKSTSSVSTKSSTGQQAKSKRSSDMFRSGGPTNGNVSGRNKAVTIVKPIKTSLSPNGREPKTDPLNLKDYIDGTDSDSSYEYESDFYGDEEDDDISNPIIDLSTDTSRTNSVADTVTPVVSEDDDPADAAVQQEHQDQTTATEPQPQQTSMCGDNELLQYYLNNLSKAETPPIYKKLSSGRKCRSSEKKSPSNSLEQVKHGAIELSESVVDKDVPTGPEENRDSIETACSTENTKEKPYNLNDGITLESVQRMSLDLAEQIMQIDNERTIEYERHSGSKVRSVRSSSNMSDDHPSTSNTKSSALAHNHVRKLTYSNDQLDKCVPSQANKLRRTKSDSAFPKRNSRGRLNKKRQSSSVATDQSNSTQQTQVATSSVNTTELPIKRKRGRPRKIKPQEIEIKSSETKPENNTETELELAKENRQNPPDKELSASKTDNETTANETISSLETQAQIENENKDSTLTEKTINATETQLSAKDVRVDENATVEIHQSQNEIPIEDSKLISEIKNVPKDLEPVQETTEALGATPEISVKRRALRSDDRKSELSSHEVETTPLQAQANESRSSRRIPKSETPVLITDQITSIRNRKRNDSLKLASEQSSASTPSDIERDQSPIDKQPRSTQKRSKDKFIRDNKELASSLSPFGERITRSTKRDEAILELPQASDSIQQRGERTRSSERSSRRDPANRSRKELEAESTETLETANQPESRTENEKSKEKSSKKKTKKTVDSQPKAVPELIEKKSSGDSGDIATKIETTISDETKIVKDVNSEAVQQSAVDMEMTPIEKITPETIQKDENIKPMQDEEVLEPDQESTKSNLEQDNIVDSDLVQPITDDSEMNPIEKIAQDKIEKDENIKPMEDEEVIESVQEPTKANSEQDNIVNDKPNTEVVTEKPEKAEEKISENSTIEKKRLRPKNKNVLDKVIANSEIEPVEQKAKLKSGRKKSRQNDNESETLAKILVQTESTQEIAAEETSLNTEPRFEKETPLSVEGPIQTQEETNLENSNEDKSIKTVLQDAVPQVGDDVAVIEADVNKKVELIQTPVVGEIDLLTESTVESNEHEQIQNEEAESMQTEIECPPEPNLEETPAKNEVNSIDEETDAVDAKLGSEPEQAARIGNELTEINDIPKVDETPCALETEPIEKTVFEDANPSVIVNEPNDSKAEDEQTLSSKESAPQSSIETNESVLNKNLSLKTARTTKLRFVKKKKGLFGKRKRKYRPKNIDAEVEQTVEQVEEVEQTVPIVESLELTEPLQPAKIEVQNSSMSTLSTDTTTSLSPTSGTCRKLRVLVKRTPTCLKGERRSLITGKKANRFAEKLDSIDESPVISTAIEKSDKSDKPDQAPIELTDKETPIINQESVEKNDTAIDDIDCNPSDEVALAHSESSIINGSETTGVTHDEESSQLDAAKQKKVEQQKEDVASVVKNQGRRRKQGNEAEQPNKKRTRLDTEMKNVEKGHNTGIGHRKTLSSGSRGNVETSTESFKKPMIQTVLGPDVSLRKPDDVKKSMDSKKINSDEQSYVTVLTKKPKVAATPENQETKTAHTSVGAAPRKVNISVSVLPAKEVEPELPVASTILEKKNITASTMVSKKNKSTPNKSTPLAPPKKVNVLNAAKIPDKNFVAQSEQSKKSESRKSEVKTGLEVTSVPATKSVAKAKQVSEVVAKTDKILVEPPVEQLPEPQPQLELEVSANKSLGQHQSKKKLISRKSEGTKARRSAIKTDPLSNTIARKSLPLTGPSQKLSSSSTPLKASEVETTESLDQSLSLGKGKSQDNKQTRDESEKVLMPTEDASTSMDASKDHLMEKKLRKTVASVTTHVTRSSSCTRSLSATPIATPQRQRKIPNKVSGLQLVTGKLEVQEIPVTPRMNSRRSQKDPSTPYLELVNHGYTRKRKMPAANAATNPKRAKQQAQPNEEKKSTESREEEVLSQEVHAEADIQQQQVQQNEMQLEQMADQNEKHQSQNLQKEIQPMETDVQQQEAQETELQQHEDVDRQQEEHTNVAFPVMITAAINQTSLPATTTATVVAHPNPSDSLVKEVQSTRQCRVRLNRNIVRNWINEQRQILQQQQEKQKEEQKKKQEEQKKEQEEQKKKDEQKKKQECENKEREASANATNLSQVPPEVPPTPSIDGQQLPALHEIEQVQQTLPPPEPTPARNEVKSEAEDIPVVEPVSQPMDVSPDLTPAVTLAPSHATQQAIRFNAPIPSANSQNNTTAINGGAAAGQLPFGSTKMFSFLYPMRYQHSYGAVGLDFCCPNLDGPMRAIDPTRLHDKVELPVLELPQYMVISTKFISKQDKNIPNKVRAKMAEMAKDGKPLSGQTIQIGMLTPDPILPVTNNASAPVSVPPIPVPSLLNAAPTSISEPEVSSIDALSKQLPRGTTLTKKILLPPGTSLPLPTGSSSASQSGPRELIQLPPICPTDKQRCELQSRVQLFDLVLQELSRRATLMTVAERQKTIEEIVKTSTLLPIDVDVGTKLLENYVYYVNRATNSNIPVPSYRIAPTTSMPSPAMTNTQSPVSNSVLSKCTPRKLPASIPLYDGDRNIIGYQRPTESVTTKGLPVTSSTSVGPTQLTQDHRVLSKPADKTNARAHITQRKVVAKTMTPPAHWTTPEETGPTIRSIKKMGTGKMISFNPPSVQKPSTTFKPQTITKSPAIGNISNLLRSELITPAPISLPAAPNITPNIFVVNQVSAQPEECILPDVTNTVPLETEIKGEVEDVVEIVP